MTRYLLDTNPLSAVLLAMSLSGWCLAQDAVVEQPKPAFVPKITISKETTWVTGPLKANGAIDYHAVVNRRYRQGVTVENNAVVLLYRAMGPVAKRAPDQGSLRLPAEA